ncbi:hypothetical protein ACSFV5_07305 [Acinetobacter sp. HC8-3S]
MNSENQTIILQNTDKNKPIQLKVNSDTDYVALTFSILASVIVSMIAAYVTIKLVTKSNTKLIENQCEQNKYLIANQNQLQSDLISSQNKMLKSEVKSKNRQEWINRVRDIMAETMTDGNSFIIILFKEHNTRIQRYKALNSKTLTEGKIILDPPYPETVQIMRSFDKNVILLDLLLSKDNEIDRKIHTKLKEISTLQGKIMSKYSQAKDNIPNSDNVNHEIHKIYILSKDITDLTKELLKSEWNRVKNLE